MLTFISSINLFGQAPEKINYQAIVRNSSGQALAQGSTVGLQFLIRENSSTGLVVYSETGTATTNQFGLITYAIGTNSSLAIVEWGTGPKYLEVEIVT